MNDFSQWFTEMKSNMFWWQRTQEMYGKKDLNKVASEVHLYLMAGDSLENADWPGWRKLFQTFARRSDDITTVSLQQGIIEKPKEDWVPLTGEERQKRLQEFLEVVKSAPPVKVIAPISHREIMLNGQVDKPKEPPYPSTKESEVIAHALHLEYIKQNYDAYTKLKLENWMPEEEWLRSLEE